jgi:7-cyano-7-deazaguanine reductase
MIASQALSKAFRTMKNKTRKTPSASLANDAVAGVLENTPASVGERLAPAVPPTVPSRRLDVFANPAQGRDYVIQFVIPEFTCNCPLTGQPDFAHFTIEMIADKLCVELKSLKLYFWSYRNVGAFHEKVTNDIVDDIVRATDPRFVRISAKWNVRGGIYTNVVAEHRKKGWKAAPPVALSGAVAALAATPAATIL